MIEFTDNAYAKLVERLSNETTKAIRFGDARLVAVLGISIFLIFALVLIKPLLCEFW